MTREVKAVIAIVALVVLLLVGRAFVPRYVEEATGVRDRWTGELCRKELGGAFCASGKILTNRNGKWVDG